MGGVCGEGWGGGVRHNASVDVFVCGSGYCSRPSPEGSGHLSKNRVFIGRLRGCVGVGVLQ